MCAMPGLARYWKSGVLKPNQAQGGEKAPRPVTRQEEKERKRDGETEHVQKTPKPGNRTPSKNPAVSSDAKFRANHNTPTREPGPEESTHIPPKFSPDNSIQQAPLEEEQNFERSQAKKKRTFCHGVFRNPKYKIFQRKTPRAPPRSSRDSKVRTRKTQYPAKT